MKKNFIKYIAALAVAPMLLSSCSDDFLNEIDPNRQTPTTFWTSEDNVMKGLSAVYNPFRRMTSGYYGGLEGIMHLQMRGDGLSPTHLLWGIYAEPFQYPAGSAYSSLLAVWDTARRLLYALPAGY